MYELNGLDCQLHEEKILAYYLQIGWSVRLVLTSAKCLLTAEGEASAYNYEGLLKM